MIVACVLVIMWTTSSRVLVLNGFLVPVAVGCTKTVSKTESLMQVGVNGFVLSNGVMFCVHDICAHALYVICLCFSLFSYVPLLKTHFTSLACETNTSLHNSFVPVIRLTIVQYWGKNSSVMPYRLCEQHNIDKRVAESSLELRCRENWKWSIIVQWPTYASLIIDSGA